MKILTLIFLFCLLLQNYAHAAFKSSSDVQQTESAQNPVSLKDDLSLPMPCGLQMTFRAIHIPAENMMLDKTFSMGIANQQNSNRGFYERQFSGHIAAPFKKINLPFEWQRKLEDVSDSGTWYFIAKYETSRLQWNAVMQALDDNGNENATLCPVMDKGMNLPVTDISWYEVQQFINRYNAWLVKNHPESLPAFASTQNIAFIRLPTEEEWEYAARGGSRVPPEWWIEKDFFPIADDHVVADYAIYNTHSSQPKMAPIGSRLPNPLGLHDTAGNAREMVDGFFRMSVAELEKGQIIRRLHGSSGGLLSKGGSFRSEEAGILPGSRDEMAIFTANGPASSSDLGFRLVLGGINVPDASRLTELRNDEKSLSSSKPRVNPLELIDDHASPVEALNSLIKIDNGEMKAGLEKVKSLLEENEAARAREDNRNLERSFRGLLYQAETLRSFAYRYAEAHKLGEQLKSILSGQLSASDREKAERGYAQAKKDLKDYLSSLEMGASYYRAGLENLAGHSSQILGGLVKQAENEYGSAGVFNEHMRQNTRILEKFLEQDKSRNLSQVSVNNILKAILPPQHYNILPFAKNGK